MEMTNNDKEVIKKILSLEKTNNRQKIYTRQEDITKKILTYIKEGADNEIQKDNTKEF